MTPRTSPPFRADHVGSLLRPKALLQAREDHAAGKLDDETLKGFEDEAIAEIVKRQGEVGLKTATDGEFRRASWHMDFIYSIDGVSKAPGNLAVKFHNADGDIEFTPAALHIDGKLGVSETIFGDAFDYLRSHTNGTQVPKLTIPSPSMVHYRGGRASVDEGVYPDMDQFWDDLTSAYAEQVRRIGEAGCTYLQFDDTSLAYLNDPKQREMIAAQGSSDVEHLHEAYISHINEALAGKPEGMSVTTHMCRGNFRSSWVAEGGYDFVAEALFNQLAVDGFFMEWDDARSGGFEPLRFVPKGKTVVLGLVTTKRGELESTDELKRRIEEASQYVDVDQLCLSPQCGFSSTSEGNDLSDEQQWAKLRLIVETAEDVWDSPVYALVAETLARLGHRTLFGLLGSGNFKFADHFVRACGGRHVWVRHEAAGVVAADTYAQATRGLGIATAHQGPGFTNTLTALTHAAKERTPLLLVVGETARGRHVNQTIDLDGVARALGAGVERVGDGASVVGDVARAAARAQRERIPVVLPLPIDLQEERGEPGEPEPSGPFNAPRTRPAPADVAAAVDLIERAERPLILGGRGAVLAGARGSLEALGERVGALYATSLRANGLFAGNPRSLGVCGGFATKQAERIVPEADLVLAFGAGLNQWTTMHGRLLGDTPVVQCDEDPAAIGVHHDVRLGLASDAGEAADALLEELERRGASAGGGWGELEPYDAAEDFDEQPGDGTIDPRRLVVELDRALPRERVITYDGGHFHWFPTAFLRVPDADSFVAAQGFQAVGLGLGSAIGLATAHPGRPAVVLCGDGGTMMSLGELDAITAQRLPVLVAIFNDAAYGAEVHHFGPMGLPTELVEFGDRDFAAVATALGARAATVRAPEDVAAPVGEWLDALDGPLVLDCKVNPAVRAERLAEAFKGGA